MNTFQLSEKIFLKKSHISSEIDYFPCIYYSVIWKKQFNHKRTYLGEFQKDLLNHIKFCHVNNLKAKVCRISRVIIWKPVRNLASQTKIRKVQSESWYNEAIFCLLWAYWSVLRLCYQSLKFEIRPLERRAQNLPKRKENHLKI